jgi:hypothetical protein
MDDDSEEDIPIAEIIRRKQEAAAAKSKQESSIASPKFVVALKKSPVASKRKAENGDEGITKKKIKEESDSKSSKQTKKDSSVKKASTKPVAVTKKKISTKRGKDEDDDDENDDDSDDDNDVQDEEDEVDDEVQMRPKRAAPAPTDTRDGYYSTKKGYLIQSLLVRWWYAIEWPEEETVKPLPGHEPLDGFKGVFISTAQGSLGSIQDTRQSSTCPCLANFKKKRAREIRDLCVAAYTEQIRQLVESEGEGTALESSLKKELKEIRSVDCEDADKEAERFTQKRK